MRATIGGTLDLRALAQLHRPRSAQEMRCAIAEMAQRGLRAAEIATASGLHLDEVHRVLAALRASGEVRP